MKEKKKKDDRWIIVVNKKTYLFLAAAVCCGLYLIWDAVMIFALQAKEPKGFLEEVLVCALLASTCVWFFVRFNSYSHWFNPDHPKPGDQKKDAD